MACRHGTQSSKGHEEGVEGHGQPKKVRSMLTLLTCFAGVITGTLYRSARIQLLFLYSKLNHPMHSSRAFCLCLHGLHFYIYSVLVRLVPPIFSFNFPDRSDSSPVQLLLLAFVLRPSPSSHFPSPRSRLQALQDIRSRCLFLAHSFVPPDPSPCPWRSQSSSRRARPSMSRLSLPLPLSTSSMPSVSNFLIQIQSHMA